ncbi:MAG: alkaline phosphatase family protein [Thermoplasmata archaeon]
MHARVVTGAAVGASVASVVILVLSIALTSSATVAPSARTQVVRLTVPDTGITHVVLIADENEELSAIEQYAPYQYSLATTYGWAPNYYSACHASLPDYEAWTDGRETGCLDFGVQNVENLGNLMTAAGLSWAGYFESMPTPSGCDLNNSGYDNLYDVLHNAWIHYKDVRDSPTICHQHIFNSAAFNESLFVNGTLPNFSMYIPNIFNDGHTEEASKCGLTKANHFEVDLCQANAWTKAFFTQVFNPTSVDKKVLKHTAFILVYDEGSTNDGYKVPGITNPACIKKYDLNLTACGGHTLLAVIDPYDTGPLTFNANSTDYNVESTIEWLFGLPSDGGFDGTAQFPAMTSLFPLQS